MNRFKLGVASLAIAACALAFAPSDAFAQQRTGFYGSVNAGGLFINDQDTDGLGTAEFSTGYFLSAAVGHRFGSGFRGEVELSYGVSELDSLDSVSVSSADASLLSVTVGGFYDFNIQGAFTPYLGGGVGLARTKLDDVTVDVPSLGPVTFEGDSSTDLTAFGEAGLAFVLSQNVEIVPAYRFQWVDNGGSGVDDNTAHIVKVGLRFGF